ncbi:MAG: hypothetical protein AAF389_08930 [Gemmatimonadota bacterium]
MTLAELRERFEAQTLPPGTFGHREHVQLAFAYVVDFDVVEALARYRDGLRRFAERAGAPQKYHETITWAYIALIQERVAEMKESRAGASPSWDDFANAHPDLLRWPNGTLSAYYPDDVLHSDRARRSFVLPTPAVAGESGS